MTAPLTSMAPMATSVVSTTAVVARDFTGVSLDLPTITPFTYTPVVRTDCVTATPDADGFVPPGACNALWQYYPSIAAAIIFSIIFGALLVAHISQSVIFKKKFCWVIIVATAWEFGSFVTRSVAVHAQQNSTLAMISQLLVLLAPLWINAFVYMVFARAIYFLVPDHRIHGIHASKIAFIFVWLDFLSFVIQLIGSFIASPGAPAEQITNGLHVYMAGIGIQEFWILIVLALAASLWVEVRKLERERGLRSPQQRGWRKVLIVLYATLTLITMRVIFRLAEFSGGESTSNPLPFTEAYFYALDAAPMAVATLLLSIVHPGTFFKGPFSEFPSLNRSEKKEVRRLRKEAVAAAKARGEGWWARWSIGREIGRAETERVAARKWNLSEGMSSDEKLTFVGGGFA